MLYRTLGSTGLEVSAVGLGTWTMGGRWWGPANDEDSIATIRKAIELGVNLFDTADVYGFGHSEKILAEGLGDRRKDVLVATKVGLRWNNKGKVRNDLSRGHILKAVDQSLRRLQTDYIDLYQAHWPDPNTPVEETVETLKECVDVGKVRYLGASNLSRDQLTEFRKFGSIETLQPPLNLFERQAELQLLPECYKENVGVLIYSPLCRGLLTGKFKADHVFKETIRKHDPLFQGETFRRNVAVVSALNKMAHEQNRSTAQLAIAWVLAHSAVSVALCGGRRPEQVIDNAGAADWRLSDEDLKRIEEILVRT
jgi:aryl-alcohol dehydrogenase-like predicted oxidoreductase